MVRRRSMILKESKTNKPQEEKTLLKEEKERRTKRNEKERKIGKKNSSEKQIEKMKHSKGKTNILRTCGI
jgi:hypothetical protein